MPTAKRPGTPPRRSMSAAHTVAPVTAREQGRAIRAYLEAISTPAKRGRKRSPERIRARMEQIEQRLRTVDPLSALQLRQERANLAVEFVALTQSKRVDRQALEDGFVAVAADYSGRKGISYQVWREMGVPAAVLQRAGVRR